MARLVQARLCPFGLAKTLNFFRPFLAMAWLAQARLCPFGLAKTSSRARLENFAEKDRIAKYAASLIRPDDWVFLDNGTTVSRMTFYLPTDFEYTVLCYNFLILAELLKHSNIKVIFPGGYYHPEDYNFTSPEAVEFIRRHRANKAFLSVSGVHQSLGITCINANIVENKKAMIESSAQNIILADSSKFGLVKANHFADIPDMDLVITDTNLPAGWKKILANAQTQLKMV